MNIKNIPPYPTLDHFTEIAIGYLDEHKFKRPIDYQEIEQQADRALDALYEARLAGHDVNDSIEIAIQVLFENIGESEFEVIQNILRTEFKDVVDAEDDQWVDYWVTRFQEEIPDLFDGCEYLAYGISAADLDINRDTIIGRIQNYFDSYGL